MKMEKINKIITKHKAIFFVLTIIFTILITRGLVLIHDPNPVIAGFEFHHFDYGLILLIFIFILVAFSKSIRNSYIFLGAIAIGLIADEFWFIRQNVGLSKSPELQMAIYDSTFFSAIIIIIILVVIVATTSYIVNRKSKKY